MAMHEHCRPARADPDCIATSVVQHACRWPSVAWAGALQCQLPHGKPSRAWEPRRRSVHAAGASCTVPARHV